MDYVSTAIQLVIIIVLIAVWGFWEYREREIRQRKALLDLANNAEPKPRRPQNWGRVTTTITTAALLMLLDIGGIAFVEKTGMHYAAAVVILLAELTVFAILLFMMAARDIKILKKG